MGSIDSSAKMQLEVLNYERLKARDTNETLKLVRICKDAGIFFLDLKGGDAQGILNDMTPVIAAQRKFFGQNHQNKIAYASDLPARGYDNFEELSVERLKMSRDEHIQDTLRLPSDLQEVQGQISNLFQFNDCVLRDLSLLLCASIEPAIEVSTIQNPKNPGLSNMCLGLAHAAAGTAILGSHLDEDLLTITYYDEPFLEVQDRATGDWKLVDVCEHMPIVNVGEELQEASKSRFYAPPHRVVQSPEVINLVMYDLNAGVEGVVA